MTYLQGFLIPVKETNREAYRAMAEKAAPIFGEYGATRIVECMGDDLMPGTRTDMKKAVKAQDDETVAFSWIVWPDRATCDAAAEKMMADERMQPDGGEMPFDGARLIYGGFDVVHDTGEAGRFGYVDGVVAQLPSGDRQALVDFADKTSAIFKEKGALRLVNGWSADVREGKTTDFYGAVAAPPGTAIAFGWIEWPDKATRDAGMAALYGDERMAAIPMAWDGPTAIFGGFVPVLDTDHR